MAEAFGVGAGIVGVLGLTIQITQVVVQFGLDWKDAPTEVKSFMNELQSLKTVLSETRTNFLEDANFKDAFQDRPSILLSELGPNAPTVTETKLSIESCKAELETVLDGLKKRDKGHRIGWERLKGPFLAKSTRKSIDNLRHYCQIFNNMISIDAITLGVITHTEMREARREQKEWHNAKENQNTLTWISSLSFEEKQRDILSKRHLGTGQWLLDQDRFKAWRDNLHDEPSALWCPGIPGAGKSVMTSIIIENLQQVFSEQDVSISYIYCDYKDRKTQTTINLISSLVKQMVLQQREMPSEVTDLYIKKRNGQNSLSLEEYSRLLLSFSNHFRRSFILIDALDEHIINDDEESAVQQTLLDVLLDLQEHGDSSGGHTLLFTSRENGLIQERLAGCIRLDIRAADADIESYVRSRIGDPTKFKFAKKVRDDVDFGNLIVSRLVEKAQGMFLLPRLHLDRLGCQTSVRNLRGALDSLPTRLGETYDDAMARIQGQVEEHSKLALSALSWISNTLRPLRLNELQHALAVQRGDRSLDEEALADETLIISVSAGLIALDAQSETIRLVHFTVEEYFRERKQEWFPDADSQITETCLTYLLFDIFEAGRCSSDRELDVRLQENCFLEYAAQHWDYHAHRAEEHTVEDLALEFLKNDGKVSSSSQVMFIHDIRYSGYSQNAPDQVSGVHLAAQFDLIRITKRILEGETVVDFNDSDGRTPLSYAAEKGYEAIIKLLLDRDDVAADSRDRFNQTPLSYAAENGHEAVIKLLLDRDDVAADSRDEFDRTPLSYTAENGHEAVMKLLLDRDDVIADSRDKRGWTPLSYAAENGYEAVVKLLLDRDDVAADSRNRFDQTPLSYAAIYGHEAVVKLLLDRDDVIADSRNRFDQTPLSYAAENGYEAVVKLLLDRDDVAADSRNRFDQTPLSYAAVYGYEAVVKLLLDRDDVAADSRNRFGQTPLSYAAENGYQAVVKLLLDRDDVAADSRDEYGRTSLSYAAANGYEAVVKLLLDRDDVAADSRNRFGQTPLSHAAENGYEAVVKLLEEKLKKIKVEEHYEILA